MPDWATISTMATAGGTMVLAVATFASVRSANRAARSAEQALQVGLRPVLFASRDEDADQRLMWGDHHWATLGGGRAVMEQADGADGTVYMAVSLRNVGAGLAVLRGWRAEPAGGVASPTAAVDQRLAGGGRPDPGAFRLQGRDLYVPPGGLSFWQAAIRDPADPSHAGMAEAIEAGRPITVDLLYGDHEGGQRTISRFSVTRRSPDEPEWLSSVIRHWNLDRRDPR